MCLGCKAKQNKEMYYFMKSKHSGLMYHSDKSKTMVGSVFPLRINYNHTMKGV